MKTFFLLTALLAVAMPVSAQISDDFTDGNFFENPAWHGDTAYWEVQNGQLKSNGPPVTGTKIALSTPSAFCLNTRWEFFVNPKLATSSGNYLDVYLLADSANLVQSTKGYFVRIGGAKDAVSLFVKKNGIATSIIEGTAGFIKSNTDNPTRIRVHYSKEGEWLLVADNTGSGENFTEQGSSFNTTISQSAYFGVLINYSSANAGKYFFDDLLIERLEADTLAPRIDSCIVLSDTALRIVFSEPLEQLTAENTLNYFVSGGIGNPARVYQSASSYLAVFTKPFPDKIPLNLYVSNITDVAGNPIQENTGIAFTYSAPFRAKPGAVLFNELLPDPSPANDLPEAEFIELYNPGDIAIALNGWALGDPGTTGYFKQSDSIKAKSYLLVVAAGDTSLFKPFAPVAGLKSFPGLNNTADKLKLYNAFGDVIDSLNYADTWYKDALKKQGGYSLERIAQTCSCNASANWVASGDARGGTPGRENTAKTMAEIPFRLLSSSIIKQQLKLVFNTAFDSADASNKKHYILNKSSVFADSCHVLPDSFLVYLTLHEPLQTALSHTLHIQGLKNCWGTSLSDTIMALYLPQPPQKNELLINELLFNPPPDGVDFVELYNHSNREIPLKGLALANVNSKGEIASLKALPDSLKAIYPGEYRACCSSPATLLEHYTSLHPEWLIHMAAMPAWNDDNGVVLLLRLEDSLVLDRFDYDAGMHYPLLSNKEGVSLERISFDAPSGDKRNWHSAAATFGFATPAYRNSQAANELAGEDEISLSPPVCSPNNDGFDDVLQIHYTFSLPGSLLNVSIYTDKGTLVKHLLQNELAGREGTYFWDGTGSGQYIVPAGIYLVYIESLNPEGVLKKWKKTCVIAD